MNSVIPPVRGYIVLLLLFYKNSFDSKLATKVDMPLNKETVTITLAEDLLALFLEDQTV